MKRLALTLILGFATVCVLPAPAGAAFGLHGLGLAFNDANGSPSMQAGSHPYEQVVINVADTGISPVTGKPAPLEDAKDIDVELPPGLVGDPGAVPYCSLEDFLLNSTDLGQRPHCAAATAVGTATVQFDKLETIETYAVYNLVPSPGEVAKLGFVVLGRAPVIIDLTVNDTQPYNVVASVHGISQALSYFSSTIRIWGNPADPRHDSERGDCVEISGVCPAGIRPQPFLTLPTRCTGPLEAVFRADSWQSPGAWFEESVGTQDNSIPPNPLGTIGCSRLGFTPGISASPTTKAASSPTGLDFSLDVDDEGLINPSEGAVAQSEIRKAIVTLPEGFSTNPAIAEGLNVCDEADLARETAFSAPGVGCPEASKIGTVEVETPLLNENVDGALYIAKPYDNPFGSLLALYLVLKNPVLGISIVQPLKVETDPASGRLTTIADELPQLPFSHFRLHFREGTRSPLVSPPGCGSYSASAVLNPWSGGSPITTDSAFEIITGPEAGPCPDEGLPPFHPALVAGTLNNAAGQYSPFTLRLSRNDSEQEFTHFSIKLPPGVTGKLAGIPFCPEAAIAAAKGRTGPNGGAEELASPSCPAASEVGRTLVGVGVGPSLAYAPGKVYLAGPYHGSPLSVAAITAAKVGPFDLGTVVVREALRVNPETAEVFIDATGSDPIPHIIQGIPVHARDIRVYVDRPDFVLNPTNCTPTSAASTVLGSGLSFASEADDNPVTVSTRFQAADCAALGFRPKLKLSLKGGAKRSQVPSLRAVLNARPGDANISGAEVILPRSEFLEQSHIRTICTRVQFNAGTGNGTGCPAASVYGRARAVTPLLDEPLEGPVYLRANGGERNLPDLVAALHGQKIDIDVVGYVDSVKEKNRRGEVFSRIRNRFATVPDAPVSKFVLEVQGGKKGLLVNSTDLCGGVHRADAKFKAQNGRRRDLRPVVSVQCRKKRHR